MRVIVAKISYHPALIVAHLLYGKGDNFIMHIHSKVFIFFHFSRKYKVS